MVDVWSRKVVAWDVAEVESAQIAADLVQRACLKERYCRPRGFGSRQCHQPPLILHADNGNAMRGATLESRLEEMGVLRSFSRPRVSNDNPYSESLFRTVKYRPDYPSRPFASKDEACECVCAFVDWYNHRHRHSAIKFVTPHQRHSGSAAAICQCCIVQLIAICGERVDVSGSRHYVANAALGPVEGQRHRASYQVCAHLKAHPSLVLAYRPSLCG